MSIHHVDVDPVRPGLFDRRDGIGEARKVGIQDGGGELQLRNVRFGPCSPRTALASFDGSPPPPDQRRGENMYRPQNLRIPGPTVVPQAVLAASASTACGTTVGPGIRRFWGRYMFSPLRWSGGGGDPSNDASAVRGEQGPKRTF